MLIDVEGYDYSDDELWRNLKKESDVAFKKRKKREFELRQIANKFLEQHKTIKEYENYVADFKDKDFIFFAEQQVKARHFSSIPNCNSRLQRTTSPLLTAVKGRISVPRPLLEGHASSRVPRRKPLSSIP